MANEGYIKLYRKMMKWGWYTDTNAKCVFLHLLFLAQYETCFYRGVKLEVGQAVTSIREIAAQTGISVKSVRVALEHLKTTQEVAQLPMGKFSVFTIKNYKDYQGEGTDKGTQGAHKGHTKGTDPYIKKSRSQEVKNIKEKNISIEILKKKFGEFENVLLTGEEHEKLVDSLGDIGAREYIERLSSYLAQSGRRYKSHYATMLSWWRKDGKPVSRSKGDVVIKPDKEREITPDMTAEELF